MTEFSQQGFESSHTDQRQLWFKASSHEQHGEATSSKPFSWSINLLYLTTRRSKKAYTGLPVVCVPQKKKALNWVVLNCRVPVSLVPRVSQARRDPGRVWSRASVTIENTRERSSLNKEFVALSFVEFKARLIASRCDSPITCDVLQ